MSTPATPTTPDSPRSFRAKVRHATFIDPQTATKSKRTFSLTSPTSGENGNRFTDGPADSLLPHAQPNMVPELNRFYWKDGRPSHWEKAKEAVRKTRTFVQSDVAKGMFKCSLAYLLGSMATFVPVFSHWFGRQDSKHMIATITVYYHPARSMGSVFDASVCACVAFLYTAAVSLVSMSISVLFIDYLHMVAVGHTVILILFVGGGLGFVGWVKLTRSDPLVNISCSLTSLSLITILTKEGAVQEGNYSFYKILQILKMTIAGVLCSSIVSLLVFPSSARLNLKKNMTEVTDQLSDMLGLITKSFISGDEDEMEDQEFASINDKYKKSSAKIGQNLTEARREHNLFGREKVAHLEEKIAQCLQRIGQSIGGLRSAAAMQFVITKEPLGKFDARNKTRISSWTATPSTIGRHLPDNFVNLLNPIAESSTNASELPSDTNSSHAIARRFTDHWRSPQEIFELFIEHLGPSMRSLAYTMKEILDDLPFNPENNYSVSINSRFELSLERALNIYKEARGEALQAVYEKKDMDRNRPVEVEADWEEAAACCGHFSYSLVEVAEQIKEFLHCLDDLQIEVEESPSGRTWEWLKFWKRAESAKSSSDDTTRLIDNNPDHMKNLEHIETRADRDKQYWAESKKAQWKQSLFHRLNSIITTMSREDNRFGIKVGFGAMLYAVPSYIPQTRHVYSEWRGEWGLLSYMLVCSMTIGASNTTGAQRFLGTALGALLALLAWQISNDSPIALAFFGFCMAYWTAWIILGKGKGPMGRFIMLTYNLSCLYSYSLLTADIDSHLPDPTSDGEEDANSNPLVFSIALHRTVAVLSGVIWGLIITRVVWPMSARQKLKDGIALLWLRMGLIWKRDPLNIFTEGESEASYMNLREENDLQQFMSKLQKLVDSSKHEFELRRPFPAATYERILKSTGRMLEAFHAMNVVIEKDLNPSSGELALLNATRKERSELCARLSHQFSVLASSMKLECSIATDRVLPSSEHTRDRLLARIFVYRKEDVGESRREEGEGEGPSKPKTKDEDYSLLYTYALVTGQLGLEVRQCLREVEDLFGVLDEEALVLQ